MTTTKVQADSAKIAAAMKGRAEAQRARRAAAKAAKQTAAQGVVLEGIRGILAGTTTADAVLSSPEVSAVLDPKPRRARRATPEEKIAKGRAKVAAKKAETVAQAVADGVPAVSSEAVQAAAKVASKSSANPRVLADPVANAKLIRMRAKWAAERTERRAAKVEETFGEQSPAAISARDDVAQAWAIERKRYAEYREVLAASKAKAD